MENTSVSSLLDELDDNVDDLEEALAPFINSSLSETTGKLPLLDKAQLYVLVTYAIESILFSYLRLNGVDAKKHAVFRELARARQYFEKIKSAENVGSKRETLSLDKAAAGRFIKHALSGNDKYDAKRSGQLAIENTRTHIRFEETSKEQTDDAAEAISSSAPTIPESSDSREPHESNGQGDGKPSTGLAQQKALWGLRDSDITVDDIEKAKPEALGESGRKRRRREESTEEMQRQRKRREKKGEAT